MLGVSYGPEHMHVMDPAARKGDMEAWVTFFPNQHHRRRYRELLGGSAGVRVLARCGVALVTLTAVFNFKCC